MNLHLGPDAEDMLSEPKKRSEPGNYTAAPFAMFAIFAGHPMLAGAISDEKPIQVQFHYTSDPFPGMRSAMAHAPDFARAVLAHLQTLIEDHKGR